MRWVGGGGDGARRAASFTGGQQRGLLLGRVSHALRQSPEAEMSRRSSGIADGPGEFGGAS